MEFYIVSAFILILVLVLAWSIRPYFNEDYQAQKKLDQYLETDFSTLEIGTFYERYIGHLYEIEGFHVNYHGALNGFEDMGRDLIITSHKDKEILIVQTKCWAENKKIRENCIFQLYGSLEHFKQTSNTYNYEVFARFYTTATYSKGAQKVADVLGIELNREPLKKSYALIKCNVNSDGDKIYHLPFDPFYDKIKIKVENGDFFVKTVEQAVAKGFRRAQNYKYEQRKTG